MSKYFTVEARSILSLGRESIKDATTALVELVKNSYDADAENVEIEIKTSVEKPFIRIADNGLGMTENDVVTKWLRIGFSDKSDEANKTTKKGRRKTGEKGIGRLSADRLGDVLKLHTQVNRETFGLEIKWNDFMKKGLALHEVPLNEIENPKINLPPLKGQSADSGTELIIEFLRDEWGKDNIDALKREISLLISPFKEVPDFEVFLKTDIENIESGKIEPEVAENAVFALDAKYTEFLNTVEYTLEVIEDDNKEKKVVSLSQFSSYLPKSAKNKFETNGNQERTLQCGDVRLKLLFFPIKERIFDGIQLDRRKIQEFVNINAGIKIYRDDIWVKPYGEIDREEWDWLNLGRRFAQNPAGASRSSFRIRPQNLVGAIFITRDGNPEFVDSAGREGLIKGDAFNDLKDFTIGCIRLLENEYHERFDEDKKEKDKKLSQEVSRVSKVTKAVLTDMQKISPMIANSSLNPAVKDRFENSIIKIKDISDSLIDTRTALSNLQEQNVIYRGLATVGISTAVFGHEIQALITSLLNSAHFVKNYLNNTPPEIQKAQSRVEKIISLSDSISNWGKYALTRIKRDKRQLRSENIKNIVTHTVNDLIAPFRTAKITIVQRLEDIEGNVFAIDVESVLINLLTNAYNACLQAPRERTIRVELKEAIRNGANGFELIVADTGPGISEEFKDRIWTPLFSTKSEGQRNSGTGLGLSIIDSIVKDLSGARFQDTDPELMGARFTIWLPLKD